MISSLSFRTTSKCELVDITKLLADKVIGIHEGTLVVMSQHTTCHLWINEAEIGLIHDLKKQLKFIADRSVYYEHDDFTKRDCPPNEPRNAYAHLQSHRFCTNLVIPIQNGKLMLGTYQSIFLVELDGPRPERNVIVQVLQDNASRQKKGEDNVIIVNKKDEVLGFMPKLEAHQKGVLHRAFSIFIQDRKGRWLLSQRAYSKYHCGGLWTNACCSHPHPAEHLRDAVHRRLKEELSIDLTVQKIGTFYYHSILDNGLQEHEIDHVYLGTYDRTPKINPEEVAAFAWKTSEEIRKDLKQNPQSYTPWFRMLFEKVAKHSKEVRPEGSLEYS